MRNPPPVLPLLLGVTALLLCGPSGRAQSHDSRGGSLALVGGTVYTDPSQEPIPEGVVLIEAGKIAAVGNRASTDLPEGLESLDCSGLTIVAGFWNSHVHLFERKWANAGAIPGPELGRQIVDAFSRYGFTSVFDTGSMWENTRALRDRIESGEVAGPRIYSTGEALVAPGAMPSRRVLAILGFLPFPAPEIETAAQASEAAAKLLEQGVDAIKLHLQAPPPPHRPLTKEAMAAAVEQADRRGKPVFAHPNSGADLLAALESGVDVVLHTTPRSGPWSDTLLETISEAQVALIPTLKLWQDSMRHDRLSAQEKLVAIAAEQLGDWVVSGGRVLFGTDSGAVDPHPGPEYALMERAGMSFGQILASLTTAPAQQFGHSQRLGKIGEGLQADLVVLKGDPSQDIQALADVQYTLRAGKVIYRRPPG